MTHSSPDTLPEDWTEVVSEGSRAGTPATLVRRSGARVVDLGVWGVLFFLALVPWWVTALAAAAWLVVPVWLGGATVGKRLFRLRVVRAPGNALGPGPALLREAFVLGSIAIPLIGVLNLLVAVNDPRRQALHDKVTATLVVVPR